MLIKERFSFMNYYTHWRLLQYLSSPGYDFFNHAIRKKRSRICQPQYIDIVLHCDTIYYRKEVNMKVINFRLNPIDEATFTACKNYLLKQNEIYRTIGITRKVTNSDVIRAGLQLLFDQARKNNCNKKTD